MRSLTVIGIFLLVSAGARAQHFSIEATDIICYASDSIEHTYVSSDLPAYKFTGAGRLEVTNPFSLELTDVPSAAETTIAYATDIWSTVISTDVPIRININWISLADGVLGSARPGKYEVNFEGAPKRNIAYPIALAERIARKELNEPDEFEIIISLNKEYTWYYGVDGNVAENTHDLLSVVLHEIGHGLGLADTFGVSGDNGSYGTDGRANVYDFFIYNDQQLQLIDSDNYKNYTNKMYRQLTSRKLVFGSDWAARQNGNEFPKIYAPAEFDGGSSISHLDEKTFSAGDPNSLMSPQLAREEAIHDPGLIASAMLADMGYVYVFIDHDSVYDQPDYLAEVTVTGHIRSDSLIYKNNAFIYYSFDDLESIGQADLNLDANNNFTATIPAPGEKVWAQFYFEVTDKNDRTYRSPATIEEENYKFGYGFVTGLEEQFRGHIAIYPNPATNLLNIDNDEDEASLLTLIDSRGVELFWQELKGSRQVDISRLNQGIYIIRITDKHGIHESRFIKQ